MITWLLDNFMLIVIAIVLILDILIELDGK